MAIKSSKKVVIIGGVAGGASAAARLRRLDEGCEITMVERGPYISFANCGLPYHISGAIADREELILFTTEEFSQRYNVKVLTSTEAIAIRTDTRTVELRRLDSGENYSLNYDSLILSPGAEPIRPPVPGVNLPGVFTLRNIPDLDRIMSFIQTHSVRRATVIGAGFIGIETAENLVERGIQVTLIEKAPQVMPLLDPEMAAFLAQELEKHQITILTRTGMTGIRAESGSLLVDLEGGGAVATELVILAIGVKPESKLAASAGIALGPSGGISVNDELRTSHPDIYAIGDAVEIRDRVTGAWGRVPLAGPANRQGRRVADVIAGSARKYRGTLATSIVKVFGLQAASVGLSEKQAQRNKTPYQAVWVHAKSHAGYYPGSELVTAKLLFSPGEGKLLGAQIVGKDGVDKRIDVLATAIAAQWTIADLEELDLAYAPPFSSAKDPINHLGTVAAGILSGEHPVIQWNQIQGAIEEKAFLLDVRSKEEFERGTIPGATQISVDELRQNLPKIPKDKRVVVFCQVGVRGYLAARILLQNGFKVVNLLGGYRLWDVANRYAGA